MPTSLSVSGNRLTLTARHRQLGIEYPVVVDPPVSGRMPGFEASTSRPRYRLSGATLRYQRGKRRSGGSCEFSGAMELTAQLMEEQGLAANRSSCTMLVRRGAPPAWIAAEEDRIDDQAVAETQSTGGTAAASSHRTRAYSRAWYEDPAFIDVAVVRNTVDWHWRGGCVRKPGWLFHRLTPPDTRSFGPSVWTRKKSHIFKELNCSKAVSSTYALFRNTGFPLCLGNDVHAHFRRNTVIGRPDGKATGHVHSWLTGHRCRHLLHPRHRGAKRQLK